METIEVSALPKRGKIASVDAGRAVSAKVNVNTPILDNRGRRCVAIGVVNVIGMRIREEFLVQQNASRIFVQAHDPQFRTVGRRRRQPNLAAPNDGSRPTFAMDGRFPANVLSFGPFYWQSL